MRRDPGYFDRQGFEFVGSDGRVVSGFSAGALDAVQRGQMRIRQRPGAGNALGDIKFVFPNQDNIYLHHTPTRATLQTATGATSVTAAFASRRLWLWRSSSSPMNRNGPKRASCRRCAKASPRPSACRKPCR
ncbi:MAG: hypothetical protein V5B44_21135 [Candidatus Accumulibacter necessarius]|uniref:hypothetical protein n=1 Tax=Candidatus Accumulibacter necessarius TaxID=2954386 RepID=UPI002FC2F281